MAPLAVAFAAACGGFLAWNWPPAKIFMGDVGSGYLGYAIAVLALAAARENSVALLVWLILGAVFFVDATVTLLRRLARRERVYEAHRSHAYQWLARRWQSHRRVTVAVLLVNFFWLLPCALVAVRHPVWAGWMVVLAIVPVTVAALLAGAGRAEGNCQTTSSASASRSNTNR
jgi:Fuc2NAc and GlcNAc transferase